MTKTPNTLNLQETIALLKEQIAQDKAIRLRAAEYHLATELYDLALPGYWSKHNEWIPNRDQLTFSSQNAIRARKRATNGFSAEDLEKFNIYSQEYARFSIERLEEEIKCLHDFITND